MKLAFGIAIFTACTFLVSNAEELQWWQTSIIYQIYPRSFQDSDGDGVGDLRGIKSRLDHFEYLGVKAIWLSPIFESPMKDFGYDISNQTNIEPIFGTMEDFDSLLKDIHSRGMKLILDYIPNHTSDLHPWFQASKLGGTDNKYTDYYVWNEGKLSEDGARVPPNNWLSIFGGSAWEWVEERQAYYYHAFLKEQPDLNYRNLDVRRDMEDVFRFWIEKGVDGFRIDAVNTMYENHYDRDEPLRENDLPKDQQNSYVHLYTEHQDQTYEVVREWRNVFDEYQETLGKHIFMVMEVYDDTLRQSMKYYESGADMPFNFKLLIKMASPDCKGTCIHDAIDDWMRMMPRDKWPNFVLGNHDQLRITTRKGPEYADALNLMLLTLPGTPTTYQGEEIAMRDIKLTYEETVDPWGLNFGHDRYEKFSRDPCRSPVHWNDQPNAGFSSAQRTWLPTGPDYRTRNIEAQKNDPTGRSSILMYKAAAALRNRPAFQNNDLEYCVTSDDIYSYRRTDKRETYLVAINVGDSTSTDDYSDCRRAFAKTGTVVLSTPDASLRENQKVDLTKITLSPGEGIVVTLPNTRDEL